MKKFLAIFLAAALLLAAGCAGGNNTPTEPTTDPEPASQADPANKTDKPQAKFLQYAPQYPERAPYPMDEDFGEDYDALNAAYERWSESRKTAASFSAAKQTGLSGFVSAVTRALLQNAGTENKVCSPINLYMALAMLAEITDGDTQKELLSVLGVKDAAALRAQANALWDANYTDDGTVKSLLADSVWLNDNVNYKAETLKTLATDYFASVFSGKPGDGAYNEALRAWINENTGNLLTESVDGVEMDPLTMVALVSAVYFKGSWTDSFQPENNIEQTFRGAKKDVSCEMMRETNDMGYYKGKGFSAVNKAVTNANGFRFILPDEGVSVDEVLASEAFAEYLTKTDAESPAMVALTVPKFDVTADSDVIPALQEMGVEKVFDHNGADFTPLTEDRDDIAVDEILHSARVKIDEEGCEAAAFTVVMAKATGALIGETVEFTLDRPFIFVINGAGGAPLFVGVVNQVS